MSCNPMFRALHEIYEDHYGNCSELKTCLIDLLGMDEMINKCKHCGLDKIYVNEFDNLLKERDKYGK